jgi:hypothetical protein
MSDNYDEDDDGDAVYISLNIETRIIRVKGNNITPSRLNIRADVNPEEDMSQEDISLALSKIRFFYDNLVAKSIAFSTDNGDAVEMLINEEGRNRTSNILMITPGEPTDDLMAMLFQAKMEALSGGRISFSLVEVKSDNAHGLTFVFVGDNENMLPDMDTWIGERSYFDRPWWNRDDASTLDVEPPEDADLTKKPAWAFSLDTVNGPRQENGVVVRPSFKPTVIDGGSGK